MERFLQYSQERDKPIRVIFIDTDGKMRQVSAVVERREGSLVSLYIIRPPRRVTVPAADILAAGYMPKDEG